MRAAIYCRSSKDRHDVSIDAQRRELVALAKTRSQRVVAEFVDAVESGKDDDREGFRNLIAAVRDPRRGWDTLLVLDTSRIARRRHLAMMFERECELRTVRLVYKSIPDTNDITGMLLRSFLQAMDEWHSLTSKAKGLAGMRENVRQGFRAGGRAPIGYRLDSIETGATRDGAPVKKSRLVPGADAATVQAYLRARAAGVPRSKAGMPDMAKASAVGLEWNAMTYAGHTVWNVHAEAGTGRKRRPRSEWVVQRDTHEALITDAEAEAILNKLEAYAPSRTRRRESGYLLAGLLETKAGIVFHGDRDYYRVKGRRVQADDVDRVVTAQVMRDIQSSAFVRAVTAAAKAIRVDNTAHAARDALAAADARLQRLLALVEQTDMPAPLLRQMETVEAERGRLLATLAIAEEEAEQRAALSRITEHEVKRLLAERAAALDDAEPEAVRQVLQGLLSRVVLDGDAIEVHYRVERSGRGLKAPAIGGIRSASRGDASLSHHVEVIRRCKIA